MSISTAIPQTIEIRRGRLIGLITGVAVVAVTITWALTSYALRDTGERVGTGPVPTASATVRSTVLSSLSPEEHSYLKTMTSVCSVVRCQPDEWLATRLGFDTRSPEEKDYLNTLTAVCSVALCQPNERLAVRLGIHAIR